MLVDILSLFVGLNFIVFSIFWTHAVPHHNFRFRRDAASQDSSERADSTAEMTSTNIAVIERRIIVRQAATPETSSEGKTSKEARSAGGGRDSEKNSEDSINVESTTSNLAESGELSTQKRASEDNEPSRLEIRASSSDEATVKPDNSSENSYENDMHKTSGNESVIETRDLKSALRAHKGTAAFGGDDYFGGDSSASSCCRTKREKSCASGNINVCNHCNVYIYNKLYEVPPEPCPDSMNNGVAPEGEGNDGDRGNNYGTRNAANEPEQQYPVAEMLYMPDDPASEVDRIPDYQKKKFKSTFKRPEGQYAKAAPHDSEYRTTSPNTEGYGNQEATSTAESPGKRETVGIRHARNVPQLLNNEDNSFAFNDPKISDDFLRSGRGTPNDKVPKSRNAKYDMKFLGLMNEQNKKTGVVEEFENAPGVEMENEGNSAGYDESLLRSKDAAYIENTNLFSPMSDFMRRNRDASSVTSEFEAPYKKLPEVRNAEYDLAFLDLMKNQQSGSHIREVRNVSVAETNGGSTEAVLDSNDRIEKIVKFLGSMKRASTGPDSSQMTYRWDFEAPSNKDDHVISARSLSDEADDILDLDNPDYDENDDESVVRTKRLEEVPKRHVRVPSDSENYNGLVASDTDTEPARGMNSQRFDNIVKLLGSIKHAENLREARNASNGSGMSDPESDLEEKQGEIAQVVGAADQSGDDIEVENSPDDVLDNANDAITVYGPGQDIALELGSTPAKQGQVSLKMVERSTDSEVEPQETAEDESDTANSDTDTNDDRFRRAVYLPNYLLSKRVKRNLKTEEDLFRDAEDEEEAEEEDKSRVERWNLRPKNNVGLHFGNGRREYQDTDSVVHTPRGNAHGSREEGRFHPGETRARLHKNRFSG